MTNYTIPLLSKKEVAVGTMAFEFAKPDGFEFTAGQYMRITLLNPPETDAEGNHRDFSISSAPVDETLLITTRMRDTAFKRVLGKMPEGATLQMEGPMGNLILPSDTSKPIVFLAGGIGITPFRSMARQAAKNFLMHKIFLFYSNRRPEDSAFLEELQALEKENGNFKLIATMTEMEKSAQPWDGERGFVDAEMLKRHLGDISAPTYFTAGPPAMVAAMQKLLKEAGVSDDQVHSEDFTGY